VTVEKIFRGYKYPKPICINSVSYKSDYKLLPKKEEADYCKFSERETRLIAPYMDLPPLLREFVEKETGRKDIKMKVVHKEKLQTPARLVKDGEVPTLEIPIGLGTPHPTAKSLYEGINI
jgi:small subunit ribosomal protein S34